MPFFYNSKVKYTYAALKKCNPYSLLVQKAHKKNIYRERVSSFTSNKGSVTIEAALCLPIFMTVVLVLLYFIVVVSFQNNMNGKFVNVAADIGKDIYLYDRKGIALGITDADIAARLYSSDFRKYVNESMVTGGAMGINYALSNTDYEENGGVLLKAAYIIKIPLLIGNTKSMYFSQALFFRPWIGISIVDENHSKGETVYITERGTVYHTNRDCSHLQLKIKEAKMDDVSSLRNSGGGKYKPCELCIEMQPGASSIVYITDSGDRYHMNKKCSGLKRTVYEISLDDVGDRKICSRCRE